MDNGRLVKNLYEAFGRGEIPTVLGAMDSGIRWYEAEGNPYMPERRGLGGAGRGSQ